MPQNELSEVNTPSTTTDQAAPTIDLQQLAEKIVELLKREARLERERTGRP